MRRKSLWLVLLGLLSALLFPTALFAGPGDGATVQFGRESLGNRPPTERPCADDPLVPPGPPECFSPGHDGSANALDDLVPRTVVIDSGETVTFELNGGVHQVAIYEPGTSPKDVDITMKQAYAGCPGGPGGRFIDDPDNREALLDPPPCNGGATTVSHTFTEPGRYLVICTFDSHYEDDMYGWVIVK